MVLLSVASLCCGRTEPASRHALAVGDRMPRPLHDLSLRCSQVLDKAALQELFAAQAPFDILISAATGGDRAFGPFLQMDMDGYAASFDKLWGYANVIRFGTEHLSPDGCIVLVSGTPAKRAKAGQISLASVGASVEHLVRSCS